MKQPVVLIHGYSDTGESFERWREVLNGLGYENVALHTCSYETLTNEVSITDIAEGFDRALREKVGLNRGEKFNAIVHSTGMLVLRSWLTTNPDRRKQLKRLIALAPATFGSPLAHKGRSWLGSIFKGRKSFGPDFMEAGDMVLDGLELGGRFTWELAHRDLLGRMTFYGTEPSNPFVFIFCGNRGYGGLRSLLSEDGSDGTVRWAGCPLNTRKIVLDLTVRDGSESKERFTIERWSNVDVPLIPIKGLNHATILTEPSDFLIDLVRQALEVNDGESYAAWIAAAQEATAEIQEGMKQYQQFVVRAVDERGDPIPDYNIQLFTETDNRKGKRVEFDMDVHVYKADPSFRCFHVDLGKVKPEGLSNLWLRIIADSGTKLVGYHGYLEGGTHDKGVWDAALDISGLVADPKEFSFFYPFTTTLVEIRLDREPLPVNSWPIELVRWVDRE